MKLVDTCFERIEPIIVLCHHENVKQIAKWGVQTRTPFEWLTYTTEELGELAKAISEHYYRDGKVEDVIKEAVQTATLVLKIAEMYSEVKNG
jgi:NTP pyrophosphatase (non-canonical NTP hydrolase)